MAERTELQILEQAHQSSWREWLEANHATSPGVWLKLAKKGAPTATVTYAQAVEEALCYGWIDGQVRRHDEHFYLQRFTPRRARSVWSQINRGKAEKLIASGRMRPAGMAEVEAAQADSRWEAAYPPQSEAKAPEDFQQALERNPEAGGFFATLTGSARYAFLYRLHHITDPGMRAARIERYVELLSARQTL